MESTKLSVLEKKMPLRNYPEKVIDDVLTTVFKFWLANLLSIKADNEEKLDNALSSIKKHFWSLGIDEVKKAFEMYADGELSIKPIPNYFDRILVGQIFQEYRQLRTKPKKEIKPLELSSEDIRNNEIISATICYDYYIQNGFLNETSLYLYNLLLERGLFDFTKKEQEVMVELAQKLEKPIKEQRIHYKKICIRRFFDSIHAKGKHIKDLL